MPCPICENANATLQRNFGDSVRTRCPRCGEFQMSRSAVEDFAGTVRPERRWQVSAWLQDNSEELITTDSVRKALVAVKPSLDQRADRMLRWLSKNVSPGRYFDLHTLG